MMDLYCPRCGEPWDIDTLHEEAELRFGGRDAYLKLRNEDPQAAEQSYGRIFQEVSKEFRTRGCAALRLFRATDQPCQRRGGHADTRAAMAAATYDILGSDIDGAAAMLEDMERGY